jgi:hypothetical protein
MDVITTVGIVVKEIREIIKYKHIDLLEIHHLHMSYVRNF